MTETPTVFVAFGVTGDLMKQKILPALFQLHLKNELPDGFEILGVSRREWDDEILRTHVSHALGNKADLESFLARLSFVKGDITDDQLFAQLAEKIGARSAILYFSLSPALYADAFTRLVASPLAAKAKQLRLMIEKPFGSDEMTARELHSILSSAFQEPYVFRVDHYLAKEALFNVPSTDPGVIKKIEVYFMETSGVETRGESYDSVGALRDVGQNHMLEMLATALNNTNREQILKELHVLMPREVAAHTVRAQYEGYPLIPGVASQSQTETYFKLRTTYRNIEVVLEGGKRLGLNRKEVIFTHENGSTHILTVGENVVRTEYERLVHDCMKGDQTLFVSIREVMALWHFIDPIVRAWRKEMVPLKLYPLGAEEV